MWTFSDAGGWRACVLRTVGIVVFLLPLLVARTASAQIDSERYAAFVQEAETGKVLFAVDADELRYPASLTKMMTLYLTFDALRRGTLTEKTLIRVSRHASLVEPSKLGLRAGSAIRVRDAIMALVTKSANDAATALGEHLAGGSEAAFARMMTRKARQIGMSRTTFRNASGLPDPKQVTTARDIAVLSRRLVQDFPEQYAYFSASGFSYKGRYISGHNRLLTGYDGADGIKTGYIRASGFNLAASAMRDGRRLIAVVFGGATARERDVHVMALLDSGFEELERDRGTGMMMAARNGLRLVGTANAAPARTVLRDLPVTPVRPVAMARPLPRSKPVRRAAPARGDWGVQVGAFGTQGSAQAAARRAAARGGRVEVVRVRVRGSRLWRARVTGLSATQARGTCRAVRGPCMVLPPGRR
jgi:D-alanyl-D-alanine carboxypeptidase